MESIVISEASAIEAEKALDVSTNYDVEDGSVQFNSTSITPVGASSGFKEVKAVHIKQGAVPKYSCHEASIQTTTSSQDILLENPSVCLSSQNVDMSSQCCEHFHRPGTPPPDGKCCYHRCRHGWTLA